MKVHWLTVENVKWALATLAIPVSLAGSTALYNVWAAKRSDAESRLKLYTELVNKREEADTNLRREIFSRLMEKYLDPGVTGALDRRLVVLELLSQNFNESLNLNPLFWQLDRQIAQESDPRKKKEFRAQLDRIAFDVKQRQFDTLQVHGLSKTGKPVSKLPADGAILDSDFDIEIPGPDGAKQRIGCHFIVEALDADEDNRRVQVRVQSMPLERHERSPLIEDGPGCSNGLEARQWVFNVDRFDFPLVNYTRMSPTERFSVAFNEESKGQFNFKFIYFPSSLGGVRDKPFIDDVMGKLRSASK